MVTNDEAMLMLVVVAMASLMMGALLGDLLGEWQQERKGRK